ncbi:ABC transporter permease [Pandoraea nosoerga]|uniref:ABC transporter permease n=1 Tax=Pandoraea sp. CB10b_02 TaxID=2014535 RepID=UPI001241ADFF|nr:ABC transporter permease [Pandoraea sp. CB10b_02]MBN4664566.1 ABC transporter permease [Pandoraea nosoerga]MBN4674398.1 ABC transporter permease [Pandoraea nosoerga]MBN4679666.1 ABC transporter permease [Pandoraea nosoerga]MBN4743245.1 ABC transporter permease [Pandoraea nosoerga]
MSESTARPDLPRYLPGAGAWVSVWRRNFLVWRKLAIASMFGNLADPMIYLFGLGFGLGMMVGDVDGTSYIAFLAAGTVGSSVMFSASFESMYSGFSRMHVQRTWEALMHTPLTLGDVVLGEVVWAASKAVLSGLAILVVASVLGYARLDSLAIVLPAILLAGLAFASLAMVMTALAPSYDFFMFYQTLVMTPMLLLSGVFFPLSQLPAAARHVTEWLPLAHAVALIRPAMLGRAIDAPWLHAGALAVYAVAGFAVALVLLRRRILR